MTLTTSETSESIGTSSRAEFGKLLRQHRRELGLSQAEVAKRAGVSTGYVGLMETGLRGSRPNEYTVKVIAHALRLSLVETESLLRAGGLLGEDESLLTQTTIDEAIASDDLLTEGQKDLMRAFYVEITRGRRRNTA